MVGNALTSEATQTATPIEATDASAECQIMYIQVRPAGAPKMRRCISHLRTIVAQHPDATVDIAGCAIEDHQIVATLAVNFGPRKLVSKPSPQAEAAFGLVSAIFTGMFDYLPQFSTAPSEAERDLALSLPSLTGPADAIVAPETEEAPAQAI